MRADNASDAAVHLNALFQVILLSYAQIWCCFIFIFAKEAFSSRASSQFVFLMPIFACLSGVVEMTPGKQTVVWCCLHAICCLLWGGWKAADGLRNLRCHTNAACADKPSQPLFSKPVIGPMCELLRRFLVHESCFSAPLRRACAECVLGVHFLECIFAAAASRLTNHRL